LNFCQSQLRIPCRIGEGERQVDRQLIEGGLFMVYEIGCGVAPIGILLD